MKISTLLSAIVLTLYVGIHNGNLALWKTGESMPLKVFPYSVSVYTQADQNILNKGIHVNSQPDITKLLDDYLS